MAPIATPRLAINQQQLWLILTSLPMIIFAGCRRRARAGRSVRRTHIERLISHYLGRTPYVLKDAGVPQRFSIVVPIMELFARSNRAAAGDCGGPSHRAFQLASQRRLPRNVATAKRISAERERTYQTGKASITRSAVFLHSCNSQDLARPHSNEILSRAGAAGLVSIGSSRESRSPTFAPFSTLNSLHDRPLNLQAPLRRVFRCKRRRLAVAITVTSSRCQHFDTSG